MVVNSDFVAGTELARVRLRVAGQAPRTLGVIAPGAAEQPTAGMTVAIPFSFGVTPPERSAEQPVLIEAEGLDPDGNVLARVRARAGFVPEQTRLLTLELTRVCSATRVSCSEAQTCRGGACDSLDIDVTTAPIATPGRELAGLGPLAPTCRTPCLDVSVPTDGLAGDAGSQDGSLDRGPSAHELPDPPVRPLCSDQEGWNDVQRRLARTADGLLCPVLTDGEEWGSVAHTLDQNLQAAHDYIDLALKVESDVLTLRVSQLEGRIVSLGFAFDAAARPERLPDLSALLDYPPLQQADQPIQLLILETPSNPLALADTLPKLLLTSRVVHACRPIYLFANGPISFEVLTRVRQALRTQPDLAALWPWVHFGRRSYAQGPAALVTEIAQTAEAGFEFVAFDARSGNLPFMLHQVRQTPLRTTLFGNSDNSMLASFCGTVAQREIRISADRMPQLFFLDEGRRSVAQSHTVLDLDVSELPVAAPSLPYHGAPELGRPRSVALGDGLGDLPSIAEGPTTAGDAGRVLRFAASRRQKLTLHDADYDLQLPDGGYFSYPILSVAVSVRFATDVLPFGARQVLVSKLEGDSGWSLERVNDDGDSKLRFVRYGVDADDHLLHKGQVVLSTKLFGLQTDVTYMVHAHATASTLYLFVDGHEENAPVTHGATQQLIRSNDVPITLGADPDGQAGFFEGDIQRVRVTTTY